MKNVYLIAFCLLMAVTSCSKYNIAGSSDEQNVDGHMLFLKAFAEDDLQSIDSCDVVHGKFKFSGPLDSTRVVMLCFDNVPVCPVVLEDGNIQITLNKQKQECKGTMLNDTLQSFLNHCAVLEQKLYEIDRKMSGDIMNGVDMDVAKANSDAAKLQLEGDREKLFTKFISENFDNCLGSFAFRMYTDDYPYPYMTPWVETLMVKATETFSNDPFVRQYMEAAKHNQEVLMGSVDAAQPQMAAPVKLHENDAPPTPNEMASSEE